MKQTLFRKLIVTAGALMCLAFVAPVNAGQPDFSICDGLSGAGWGLCRAGVAAGCEDGTGNSTACANIESQFLQVTGNYPPWIIPPVTCPCDYDALDKESPPWSATLTDPIVFFCDDYITVFSTAISIPATGVAVMTSEGMGCEPGWWGCGGWGDPTEPFCVTVDNDAELNYAEPLTADEVEACIQDVIDYVQAFRFLNSDVPVDDMCTPTLSP